jgi:Methyltransferase domain
MAPAIPLPISADFNDVDEYVNSLLHFATSSTIFQTLCGGVHILDFFTRDPSLYNAVIPEEWKAWLMDCDSMELLDLLIRDNLQTFHPTPEDNPPPHSLITYITDIRKYSLQRSHHSRLSSRQPPLPRHLSVGMVPKKIHEVSCFANYVANLADDIATDSGHEITHFVDYGSGQNYLGRTLASPPYNKHIIAVESKELNINGAKNMDVLAKVAEREVVMRNKKLYRQKVDSIKPERLLKDKALRRAANPQKASSENVADLRPNRDLATIYTPTEGRGSIQYVEHVINDGNLSNVVQQIENAQEMSILTSSIAAQKINSDLKTLPRRDHETAEQEGNILNTVNNQARKDCRLLAISVHSCGNLSHHGIRSLLLNPSVQAIAIIGCCYNLVTERLGPQTYKLPILRQNLQPINARVSRESERCDPHGFPMSERVANYNGGIRLNITARMMAVQAPQNWTKKESDSFFTRHFFRALLQKVFLDRGVVSKPYAPSESGNNTKSPQTEGTDPVIIGSLRKGCYGSFTTYVRGAVAKLTADPKRGTLIKEKMGNITDEEIEQYVQKYTARKKELSIMWSLMAFSAGVVESLIVVDRWLFLKEHPEVVRDAWVEAVFDYKLSPRNLVVVGIKRYDLANVENL